MELFLHQVLAGIATGGIYACMALAIVMIYQAINQLNFAQGEMAMFSTFIAVFAIINSAAGFIWEYQIKSFPTPFGTQPLLGEGLISAHDAGMIGVTVLMLILLYLFFRYTRIGLAMRAAAANPESARLVGIRVGWGADGGAAGGARGV